MKTYFAYIRVSTDKQGEQGVSLQEQREIIQRYASHKSLEISRWFQETETASKIGRPVFNEMLTLLKAGQASGVVIHKVDRSARNRWDWAEIAALAESGVDIHFATESLDLNTLGGMLSADIQAAMASYYSRNLREEVKKGYYGRLKQGLCPYPAPLGYLNNGKGKPKTIDPLQGPIVRQAFELYASGRYSLRQLTKMLYEMGMRTRATPKKPGGLTVSCNSIAGMLSNPFYAGEIHIQKTDRTFAGIHDPLIPKRLFDKVQQVKSGRYVRQIRVHSFIFSRMIECVICGRSLIAEMQKGHVYYRCHQRHKTILKEKLIEKRFAKVFKKLKLLPEEEALIDVMLEKKRQNWTSDAKQQLKSEELRLAALRGRIDRLTDAYLDGILDKEQFEKKKTALMLERREAEKRFADIQAGDTSYLERWTKIVELIKTAYPLYKRGLFDEKRRMVNKVMSNRVANGKRLDFTVRFPFSKIAKRNDDQFGGPLRGASRTWEEIFEKIGDHIRTSESDQDAVM